MFCLKSPYKYEGIIKKSRFIGVLLPCNNENEAMAALHRLQVEHPAASHIAFAYRVKSGHGFISRFHDAGEPGGTAGKPIFQHLEGKNLMNVLLAVIRYFGGVKLGAGGLTRAYGNTARQVIESAEFYPYIEYAHQQLHIDYKQMPSLEHVLKKLDGEILEQSFTENIYLTIKIPKENLTSLLEILKPSQQTL